MAALTFSQSRCSSACIGHLHVLVAPLMLFAAGSGKYRGNPWLLEIHTATETGISRAGGQGQKAEVITGVCSVGSPGESSSER